MPKVEGNKYLAHLRKGDKTAEITLNYKAKKSDIKRITAALLKSRKLVIEELMNRGVPVLDLRYENMTCGNKSVSEMPGYMSEMVAHFLCVEDFKLTTDRIKIAPDDIKVEN